MARVKYGWTEMNKIAEDMGLKIPEKKSNNDTVDKNSRREKFARCKKCGGQMTYIKGTNVLVCNNDVEVDVTEVNESTGVSNVTKKKEKCGAINMVAEQYQSYMNYLFN